MQNDFSATSRSRVCSIATRAFALTLFVGSSVVPASAAIVEYTSRATFLASAGATTTETFDAVTIDSQFRTQAFNIGPFAITGFGANQGAFNVTNPTPSVANTIYNVNLSPFVLGITDVDTGFTITFNSAITAFGADFRGFNNLDIVPRSVSRWQQSFAASCSWKRRRVILRAYVRHRFHGCHDYAQSKL